MTTFADVLPVEQVQSHQYRVNLEEQWCIGTGKSAQPAYVHPGADSC